MGTVNIKFKDVEHLFSEKPMILKLYGRAKKTSFLKGNKLHIWSKLDGKRIKIGVADIHYMTDDRDILKSDDRKIIGVVYKNLEKLMRVSF